MLHTLFEDHSIIAIEKPSGLPSHSLTEDQVSCESTLKQERPSETLFLAHRLDTGTSGVLVFAKNESTYNEIREQFKLKKIQKRYLAWSENTAERSAQTDTLRFPHTLDWPLAHHAKSKKRMIALTLGTERNFRGKAIPALSILHGMQEETFADLPALKFDLEIVTGVMHQIRVHLATLGFPLIGDTIYERSERMTPIRLALHARKISFQLGGFLYEIESDRDLRSFS
jgi:23S rRNA pseudouridine1911/1915/1917 synthase